MFWPFMGFLEDIMTDKKKKKKVNKTLASFTKTFSLWHNESFGFYELWHYAYNRNVWPTKMVFDIFLVPLQHIMQVLMVH